jgi:hypothetical protein
LTKFQAANFQMSISKLGEKGTILRTGIPAADNGSLFIIREYLLCASVPRLMQNMATRK